MGYGRLFYQVSLEYRVLKYDNSLGGKLSEISENR